MKRYQGRFTRAVIFVLITCFIIGCLADAQAREKIRDKMKKNQTTTTGTSVTRVEQALLKPLGNYPVDTRLAILEVAAHPELIEKIAANPSQFKMINASMAAYPQSTKEAVKEITEYPAVINVLVNYPRYTSIIGTIYSKNPDEVKKYVASLSTTTAAATTSSSSSYESTPTSYPEGESTASAVEVFYDNPLVQQELCALQQACGSKYPTYAAYSNYDEMITCLLATEALALYALNNCYDYPYLSTSLCQYATYYPYPAVDQWYNAMAGTYNLYVNNYNNVSAYVETANILLQNPNITYQNVDAFLNNPQVQNYVLGGVENYPQLTAQLLEANTANPSAAVDKWKTSIEQQYPIKLDPKNPQAFAEQASLYKKFPQYQNKPLTDPAMSSEVLKRYQQYPGSAQEIIKKTPTQSNVSNWSKSHQNISQQIANPAKNSSSIKTYASSPAFKKSGTAAKSVKPPPISAKSMNVNKAASMHSKSWSGAAKSSGMPTPGGGGKSKAGSMPKPKH